MLETTYNPSAMECHWYPIWEQSGYFRPSNHGSPYCIMLPPPNVTGTLHMGHGFQMTLMDALIRYHRMRGENVLWQAGTDHAGIATQMVVERQLIAAGQSRLELGRDAFIEKVWEWKGQSDGNIKRQMRRLGCSADWSRERFTLDESICLAVQEVFIKLHDEGLIYRGKRLVNWDPILQTAVSDLEVVQEEQQGQLWYLRYPLVDSDAYIVVATSRPETLFGDVAIAVHPDDTRYQQLIGKFVKLPLTDRTIPIIADTMVETEFGTGCVKITPAHDFNDYAVGQRHQLPLINILTSDAHLNDNVPATYRGMDRALARKQVVEELQAQNLIEKIENHVNKIPKGDRTGAILEPFLTDQWFVKAEVLAKPALAAVKNGEIKFVPESWNKTYYQWLENIQDWCISRQLWWGHRIPAWYDAEGHAYVGRNERDVREKYHLAADLPLKQDNDVLDTWFSSALWPFATLDWPEQTIELKTFYPTDVLVTGFDIIFFWVARMVMMGLHFTGKVPFREIYITGLIRDAEGQKMSKSKGNVLDPIDLIDGIDLSSLVEKRTAGLMQPAMAKRIGENTKKEFPQGISAFGADAVRFTYCALATTGRDIRFDLARTEGYRNFCNKLWNAARFVLMNTENQPIGGDDAVLSLPDHWILSRLQDTIEKANLAFTSYRFDLLAQALYEFTWNEYCDWYLEFTKPILYSPNSSDAEKRGTRQTLIQVLETLLRLIHPLMPFITEEIWQSVKSFAGITGDTIMLQPYPFADKKLRNIEVDAEVIWLKKVILGIRQIRGEMNIAPKITIPLLLNKATDEDLKRLKPCRDLLMTLAKIESITVLSAEDTLPLTATAIADQLELHIPLAGLIDVNAEATRLRKEITKLQQECDNAQKRLDNPNYVAKAPAAVVAKEKEKVTELNITIGKLEQQLLRLASINQSA